MGIKYSGKAHDHKMIKKIQNIQYKCLYNKNIQVYNVQYLYTTFKDIAQYFQIFECDVTIEFDANAV